MNACFADTSYFLALLIPGDTNHASAHAWSRQSRTSMVTTEYVVMEVGNFLSPQPTRGLFAAFLRALQSDARLTLLPATSELMRRGADL